jgi:hypothetical protein
VLAVLGGGKPEAPARVEVPVPDEADVDVKIIAKIRDGRVTLAVHYETARHVGSVQ